MKYEQYRESLLALGKDDQKYRDAPWKSDKWKLQYDEIDPKNMAELAVIVKEVGWPTISMVGKEAANATILIAQHSKDLEESLHFLGLVKDIFKKNVGEIDSKRLAGWIDAMCLQQQIPQEYGQYFIDYGNGLEIYPIKCLKTLALRRKQMGLLEYEKHFEDFAQKHPEHEKSLKASYVKTFGS